MLHAKPVRLPLVFAWRENVNGVARRSGRDASCENRICTVKCEIGALSASRRVHNFNDFRAGTFGVTCFARRRRRSKVDANQTPWFETSVRMIHRVRMKSMTGRVIIKRSDDGLSIAKWYASLTPAASLPLALFHIKGNLLPCKCIHCYADANETKTQFSFYNGYVYSRAFSRIFYNICLTCKESTFIRNERKRVNIFIILASLNPEMKIIRRNHSPINLTPIYST